MGNSARTRAWRVTLGVVGVTGLLGPTAALAAICRPITAVPEPSVLGLVAAAAIAGILFVRGRK